jgi:transposase
MRALDPEVVDAVWAVVEPLVRKPPDESHPLGCHRPRISDRICFEGMLNRVATGCSWVDAERCMRGAVSDTTLRGRRDEWEAAGVMAQVAEEALRAYDKIIGLDLSELAVDGSMHKAPCGGEGTGKHFKDPGRMRWKWSILTDREGIPVAWTADAANCHDVVLFAPTLDAAKDRGLHLDIETLYLDGAYDAATVRQACAASGIDDVICGKNPRKSKKKPTRKIRGRRWPALAGRTDQLLALELWATPPQHRPQDDPSHQPIGSGHRPDHYRKAHRLAQPLEPSLSCLTAHPHP